MEANFVLLLGLLCAFCCSTEAQFLPTSPLNTSQTSINNANCGISKLCFSNPSKCNPSGSSSCYFGSTQLNDAALNVELSAPTSGYVALEFVLFNTNQAWTPVVFVCGNNNSMFFAETATRFGQELFPTTVVSSDTINVTNVLGLVNTNPSLIQCTFNITFNSNFFTTAIQSLANVTILNGTTNGTVLGTSTTVFKSFSPLNLTVPTSNDPAAVTFNINRTNCGAKKLCIATGNKCDPSVNSSCFFTSIQSASQNFLFELSGSTSGYVALGLTQQGSSVVFVCANDNSFNNINYFFLPATKVGKSLLPIKVETVFSNQGVVSANKSLIQCIFNTSNSFSNISLVRADSVFTVSLMNGNTSGSTLGDPETLLEVKVDISNATALNGKTRSTISVWTTVLMLLVSALILCFM